jgi:polyketide biosynthesis 3-hydroxy-3-methylglutaryl-CoA synthase-like enzyme PksG
MVKGAHRNLLRRHTKLAAGQIDDDFASRVEPSLAYCSQVGNIYSAALYLALCSLVDHGSFDVAKRVGCFSYGSGCGSEFYSGVICAGADERVRARGIAEAIAARHPLAIDEYELISDMSGHRMSGVEHHVFQTGEYASIFASHFDGRGLLVLDRIEGFHRRYRWS